jgi:hypothetical protein
VYTSVYQSAILNALAQALPRFLDMDILVETTPFVQSACGLSFRGLENLKVCLPRVTAYVACSV